MIKIENLNIVFEDFVLQNINFTVDKGDYVAVLGVSGAGKSVLLEAIAGIIKTNNGSIYLNDILLEKINPKQRKIAIIYQDLVLFPHFNVYQNIEYPLKIQKLTKKERKERILSIAGKIKISHLLKRFPSSLSGGEQQRIAIARAIAADIDIFLLDEPLSALDLNLKDEIKNILKEINKMGKTIIHITHDPLEAVSLANKVAVIHNGILIQFDTILNIAKKPVNSFVANFFGTKNFFQCNVDYDEVNRINIANIEPDTKISFSHKATAEKGYIFINEEDIILSNTEQSTSAINNYSGIVSEIRLKENYAEVEIDAGIKIISKITHKSFSNLDIKVGNEIWVSFKATAVKFVDG